VISDREKQERRLEKKVYKVPDDLDKRVAKLKLESMGIQIDRLTGAGRVFGGMERRDVGLCGAGALARENGR
jgi:S-adenosylhomocysteine hydrolase